MSDPGSTRSTRKGQLFFVNGRLVDSKAIEKGLIAGYGGRIFSGHPSAFLFIEEDPSKLDVNIHPGKREIRFLRENEIVADISDAVRQAMLQKESVPSGRPAKAVYSVEIDPAPVMTGEQSDIREYLSSLRRPEEIENKSNSSLQDIESDDERASLSTNDIAISESVWKPDIDAAERELFDFAQLEYRGYLFDTYIVMQSPDTVYLFDQHAAHERIFYERFVTNYLSGAKMSQPILTPVTISVSSDVYYMSREWLRPLEAAGFEIEDFGAGSFIVRSIPAYMELSEAEAFARSYLEEMEPSSAVNSTVIDKLIMKSCKSAVKGGEHLSRLEIDRLIRDLAECSNPYCCPHGRPTFIRYTEYEIERSFRRK